MAEVSFAVSLTVITRPAVNTSEVSTDSELVIGAQYTAKSVIGSEWVAIGWSASLVFFLVNARPAHSPRVAAPVLLDVKVLDHLLEKVWVAKGLSFSNVVDQVPALERQRVRGGGVTPGSPAKEEKISSVSMGCD